MNMGNKHDAITGPMTQGGQASWEAELEGQGEYLSGSAWRCCADNLEPGERILGRFVITNRLGEGRFTVVYAAHDLVTDENVALKMLSPVSGRPEWVTALLLREYKVFRCAPAHPHLLGMHGLYATDRAPENQILSMEIADGGSGRAWQEAHSADWKYRRTQGMPIFLGVCEAQAELHRVGIYLIDLKPENILICGGAAKIGDLALAACSRALLAGIPEIPVSVAKRGTREYLAPECAESATERDVGPAADVFALGVLGYEMFSMSGSRPPVAARSKVALKRELAGLRRPFQEVLLRCLAEDPGDRYGSAGELIEALSAAKVGRARPPIIRGSGPGLPAITGRKITSVRRRESRPCQREAKSIREVVQERKGDNDLESLELLTVQGSARSQHAGPLSATSRELRAIHVLCGHWKKEAWKYIELGAWELGIENLRRASQINPGSLPLKQALKIAEVLFDNYRELIAAHMAPGGEGTGNLDPAGNFLLQGKAVDAVENIRALLELPPDTVAKEA
jgi:serine/threonine protein kinase